MSTDDDRTPEEKRRERGRAVLLGLFLALGVVAFVGFGRGVGVQERTEADWPSESGVYRVVAECEGCGCEPEPVDGQRLAYVHPGFPVGHPVVRSCDALDACAAAIERRTPPGVRAPVVHAPSAEPHRFRQELDHGPGLSAAPDGGYRSLVHRSRQSGERCIRVERETLLGEADPAGRLRWTERYATGEGPGECPERAAPDGGPEAATEGAPLAGCAAEIGRVLEPISRARPR